ncbi:periplasmic nitrate reductase subunit NapA apoprotein [Candidatus Kryptonium thompsonii]|jgi:nitrate reductase NapA|nr:periplasmic nitrate reductase subunit NapA apoprotein [Candidatus Kryptonium thompsoni]CUT07438.1 periplasmic nitrate reductase subunit NapA apoprotein [Candidatus Kryptonium thompsoni]
MRITRREFLKLSAIASAALAAEIYMPDKIFPQAKNVKSFPAGPCRYCAVGCTTIAECEVDEKGNILKVLAIKGDKNSSVNRGVLCTKGFYLHKALEYPGRPVNPMIRKEWLNPKTGKPDISNSPRVLQGKTSKDPDGLKPSEIDLKENFVEISWEDAIEFVANVVEKAVKEHGKFSVAYYGSGQLGTEETHIMNKVFKGGGLLANNSIEGQPRTCMASAVVGYLYTFGKDEPYGSLDDIDVPDPDYKKHADTFFIIGSNIAEAHPIIFNRIAAVKSKNPDKVKVIIADPRKTRSGVIGDIWLPISSGRDIALINSMAYVIAFELDNAKYDLEKGEVSANWKYLDKKFIYRHVSFGIHEDVKKIWIKTEYGGARGTAWDLSYTNTPRSVYPDPKKKYNSEDEIEKDLWKGFAIFLRFLEDYKPEKVADAIFEGESPLIYDRTSKTWKKISGPEAIRIAAKWFAEGYVVTCWTMGVNQKLQGSWVNASLHMLHLITGKVCKPGRHSFSFTGQPNACGGIRAPGALCHALPYGRLVANPLHRSAIEGIWKNRLRDYLKKKGYSDDQIEEETKKISIHPIPGPHTVEMFRRYGAGQIKVMFISTVNPGQSLPYAYPYRLACAGASKGEPWPITVTLEAFPTSSTLVSDIILPASSWYEKEFVFGNLERRYQLVKQVVRSKGGALPDSVIFAMIMRRLEEKGIVPKGHISQFWPVDYSEKEWLKRTVVEAKEPQWIRKFTGNIWDELRELSRGTGYEFTGMHKELLVNRNWGYRIPMPEAFHSDEGIKQRYLKYESRIQYAYPYDPIVDLRTKAYLSNLEKFNPVYKRWVEKNLEEEKADHEYHRANNVPNGWYVSFYNSNVFIHGMVDDPSDPTKKIFVIDGRAIAWANPWWACKWDGKNFVKYKTVEIIERKFNPKKVEVNSAAPYDEIAKYTVNVIGDPDKELTALKLIALSPGEFPNLRCAYKKPDGTELVIYDTSEYKYGASTGRVLEHWHTGTMTGRVPELIRAVPGAYVEINSELAKELKINDGDPVIVETQRGKIELKAKVLDVTKATGGPRKDFVFIPWFDERKLINMIMPDRFDPFSFQPDYKMFAVKLYKGTLRVKQALPDKPVKT